MKKQSGCSSESKNVSDTIKSATEKSSIDLKRNVTAMTQEENNLLVFWFDFAVAVFAVIYLWEFQQEIFVDINRLKVFLDFDVFVRCVVKVTVSGAIGYYGEAHGFSEDVHIACTSLAQKRGWFV